MSESLSRVSLANSDDDDYGLDDDDFDDDDLREIDNSANIISQLENGPNTVVGRTNSATEIILKDTLGMSRFDLDHDDETEDSSRSMVKTSSRFTQLQIQASVSDSWNLGTGHQIHARASTEGSQNADLSVQKLLNDLRHERSELQTALESLQMSRGEVLILRDHHTKTQAEHDKAMIQVRENLAQATEQFAQTEDKYKETLKNLTNEKFFMQQDLNEIRSKLRKAERNLKESLNSSSRQPTTPSPRKSKRHAFSDGFDYTLSPTRASKRIRQNGISENLSIQTENVNFDSREGDAKSPAVETVQVEIIKEIPVLIDDKFEFIRDLLASLQRFAIAGSSDISEVVGEISKALLNTSDSLKVLLASFVPKLLDFKIEDVNRDVFPVSLYVLEFAVTYNTRLLSFEILQNVVVVIQELYFQIEAAEHVQKKDKIQLQVLSFLENVARQIDNRHSDFAQTDNMIISTWMSISSPFILRILSIPEYRGQDYVVRALEFSTCFDSFGSIESSKTDQMTSESTLLDVLAFMLSSPPGFTSDLSDQDSDSWIGDSYESKFNDKRIRLFTDIIHTMTSFSSTAHGRESFLRNKTALSRIICFLSNQLEDVYRAEFLTSTEDRCRLISRSVELLHTIVFDKTDNDDLDPNKAIHPLLANDTTLTSSFNAHHESVVAFARIAFTETMVRPPRFDHRIIRYANDLLSVGRVAEEIDRLYIALVE
ncbi:uncharacterized protein V1516DRAFT_691248 [Lipomyces oligophaga]|uniref:uncharacterized protein n=1 Tax=Lipomyces oligophaga TaxID=45792 RepID=UPI0034D00CDF